MSFGSAFGRPSGQKNSAFPQAKNIPNTASGRPSGQKFLISLRTNALLQAKNKPKQPSGQKGKSHQNIHCTLSILQSQSIASAFNVSPYNLLKIYRLRNFSCASALFSYFLKFIVKIYYERCVPYQESKYDIFLDLQLCHFFLQTTLNPTITLSI